MSSRPSDPAYVGSDLAQRSGRRRPSRRSVRPYRVSGLSPTHSNREGPPMKKLTTVPRSGVSTFFDRIEESRLESRAG